MIKVSEISHTAPAEFLNDMHKMVYELLQMLNIPFDRVDTDEAISMEDCINIANKLKCPIVKTLFLCNRQKTNFYLLVTTDSKSFSTKNFSQALGIARVSFAPAELLWSMLGCKVGGTSVLSSVYDTDNKVQIVIDKDILGEEWYGCSDGTTTSYMRLPMKMVMEDYLTSIGHQALFVNV